MIDTTVSKDRSHIQAFAVESAQLLKDRHCSDIRLLDVRGLSQVCDFILLGSGTSDRQMKSLAQELKELAREHGQDVFRANSDTDSTWIITDFVDLVVHLFEPNLRAYYDLEGMWSDSQPVAWERDDNAASA